MEPQDITIDYNLFNKTRKKCREHPPVEPKPKVNKEAEEWKHHLEKGEKLFSYMVENFDSMFSDDIVIKEFCIRPGRYGLEWLLQTILTQYMEDIQKELIPWIKTELKEQRLFNFTLWKPFRDQYDIPFTYLGYRKLFEYKNYLFQLSLDDCCGNCNYFLENIKCDSYDPCVHFQLALYAITDSNDEYLTAKPLGTVGIDMMMPERWWATK
jgi:hypothetical protein